MAWSASSIINLVLVDGDLTGQGNDTCVPIPNTDPREYFTYTAAYTADITDIVIAGGGNGSYTIHEALDEPISGALGALGGRVDRIWPGSYNGFVAS